MKTEIIDKLFLELSQFTKARTEREIQLNILLNAVDRKYPGETRFEEVTQFRKHGCVNWYDGKPDNQDGGGPYETRTIYIHKN